MALRLDATRRAQTLFAEPFVREYLTLLKEGWNPNLTEFLRRVPDELREEVFARIDAATANQSAGVAVQEESAPPAEETAEDAGVEPAPEEAAKVVIVPEHVDAVPDAPAPPEPQAETPEPESAEAKAEERAGIEVMTTDVAEAVAEVREETADDKEPIRPSGRADRFVPLATRLVPWDLRLRFQKDLQEELWNMRRWGTFTAPKLRSILAFVLNGFAQHAPLRDPEPPRNSGIARGGWLAWRVCGPLLFLGTLLNLPLLLAAGGGLLVGSFATLLAGDVRLTNAVLGAGLLVLALAFLGGIVTASLVAAALLAGKASAASAAVAGFATWFTGVLGCATGFGWSPRPWGVNPRTSL